jgi:hypothetical protein
MGWDDPDCHATHSPQARLRVNTFHFPAWTLSVDGVARPTEISNPEGVMEFPLTVASIGPEIPRLSSRILILWQS